MRKLGSCAMALIILAILLLAPKLVGQEAAAEGKEVPNSAAGRTEQLKPFTPYRLEFVLSELEDGKKINTRSYSMLSQDDGSRNKLRIGSRVPMPENGTFVQNNPSQYTFHDLGVNIDCRLQERGNSLLIDSTIDATNLVGPDNPSQPSVAPPVVHSLLSYISTTISPNKPVVLTHMDDPTSKRAFEIEVTATKLK